MLKTVSKSVAAVFISVLAGCTAIPEYKQSVNDASGAFIIPNLTTSKLIASAASVDIVSGPAVCGEVYPEPKRVFRLSQRNPLISILNADGAWVPAGVPINLVAMIMMDGVHCGQAVSFRPEQGQKYKLNMEGKNSLSVYALPTCEVSVIQIDAFGKEIGPAPDFKPLSCTSKQ